MFEAVSSCLDVREELCSLTITRQKCPWQLHKVINESWRKIDNRLKFIHLTRFDASYIINQRSIFRPFKLGQIILNDSALVLFLKLLAFKSFLSRHCSVPACKQRKRLFDCVLATFQDAFDEYFINDFSFKLFTADCEQISGVNLIHIRIVRV